MLVTAGRDSLLEPSERRGASNSFLSLERDIAIEHRLLLIQFVQRRQEQEPTLNVEREHRPRNTKRCGAPAADSEAVDAQDF
jgi:hypothetical protein